MKACVFTLGCKVNETESACIMASLEKLGWEVSDRLCPADIYGLRNIAVFLRVNAEYAAFLVLFFHNIHHVTARLLLARPAIGAKLARLYPDCLYKPLDRLKFQRFELKFVADCLAHCLAALCLGIAVFLDMLYGFLAL